MHILSERLAHYRKLKNYTHAEMADLGKISRPAYAKYEKNTTPNSNFIYELYQNSDFNVIWYYTGIGNPIKAYKGITGKEITQQLKDRKHRLRVCRRALHKEILDFADALGLDEILYQEIEDDHIQNFLSSGQLWQLKEKFGLDPCYIMDGVSMKEIREENEKLKKEIVDKLKELNDLKDKLLKIKFKED